MKKKVKIDKEVIRKKRVLRDRDNIFILKVLKANGVDPTSIGF